MTCYTRHLKEIFDEAGVQFTKENKKRADQFFKSWLGKDDCPDVWKELKIRLNDTSKRKDLIKNLQKTFA